MEAKKSKEANLEDKIIVFRSVGLVMVSAIVLMAFTVSSVNVAEKVIVENDKDKQKDEMLFDLIIETPPPPVQEVVAPPPPPPEDVIIEEDDAIIEEVDFSDVTNDLPPPDETGDGGQIEEEPITDFSDVEPEFPGGPAEMNKFIASRIVYPELAKEMDEQGIVYVRFVVNRDGTIQDVEVLKGVSDQLDREAMRVVKMMPPWKPGEQAGKAVRVRYTVPINFIIK